VGNDGKIVLVEHAFPRQSGISSGGHAQTVVSPALGVATWANQMIVERRAMKLVIVCPGLSLLEPRSKVRT